MKTSPPDDAWERAYRLLQELDDIFMRAGLVEGGHWDDLIPAAYKAFNLQRRKDPT